MDVLRISLFGSVRVVHGAASSEVKVTPGVQALLAYLVLHRHRCHPRVVLAHLFWGDRSENRARNSLSTALWRLRKAVEPDGVPRGTFLVTTPTGDVGFNCASEHWLDVEVFEDTVADVLRRSVDDVDAAAIADVEEVLELYKAELLEGFYDDWALRERERLRILHLNSLAYLMNYYRHQRDYGASLAWGREILQHDPLREEIHREVMRLYTESGQRALALRQYEACCEILVTELGVPPMEATRALYAQIAPETAAYPSSTTSHGSESTTLHHAVETLRVAIDDFNSAQEQLQRAIQLLEHLAERQ